MEIKYSKATEDDHAHVTRALEWAKRWDMAYGGIPIDDGDSYEEGVIIKFIVPEGFNKADVEKAAKDVVQDRDVIGLRCVECPSGWLEEAGWKQSAGVEAIETAVSANAPAADADEPDKSAVAAVLTDMIESGVTISEFKDYAEFQSWWKTYNHYEIQDSADAEVAPLDTGPVLAAYEAMKQPQTFVGICARYVEILKANPGSLMKIGDDMHAGFDERNELFGAYGTPGKDGFELFPLESCHFDEGAGAWEGQAPEEALLLVIEPQITTPELLFRQGAKAIKGPGM